MLLKKWEEIPEYMRTEEVRIYYDILQEKKASLIVKRAFDVAGSLALLVLLSPVFLVTAVAIKLESEGPVFFRQKRVGRNGRIFSFKYCS